MAPVIALPGKDHDTVLTEDTIVIPPARETFQIVCADDQGKLVPGFPLPQRIQRTDRIMRRFHSQFDIIHPHPDLRMPLHGSHGGLIPLLPRQRILRILEGTLWRHDEVHPVERRIPRQVLHDGLMADM